MERTEYIVAAVIGLASVFSWIPMPLYVYGAIALAAFLGCALLFVRQLTAKSLPLDWRWSAVLSLASLGTVAFLHGASAARGSVLMACFLGCRSLAVYRHNQRNSLEPASDIAAIRQEVADLNRKFDEIGRTVEPARNSVPLEDLAEEILRRLKEQRVDFTNGKLLRNEQVRVALLEAFSIAKHEVSIVSPWVNRLAVNSELLNAMEGALRRNVRIKILYGISGTSESDRQRLDRSEAVIDELRKRFRKYGDRFCVKPANTHEKLLLCDEAFMMIGSFNLLSFSGKYNGNTRSESMYYLESPEQIRKTRQAYFELM